MRYVLFFIAFFTILGKTFAQENDSVEIVYDTVYTSDTVHQKQEVTIVNQQEYVLDFSTGLSFGYSIPANIYKGDSCVSPKNAMAISAFIPFTANFRPVIVSSGIQIEQLSTILNLQYRTSHFDSSIKTITDTLDVYYVKKNGITEKRVLTSSRDTVIKTKVYNSIATQSRNTYTFISVPLLFGYQLDKKRFNVSTSVGAYFSYLGWSGKKNMLSKDSGTFEEKTITLHRFYISPAVNTQCIVPISNACDIACGLLYRYSPVSIQKRKSYNTTFQSITINVSLFYHF
jgi:hypothetical protein